MARINEQMFDCGETSGWSHLNVETKLVDAFSIPCLRTRAEDLPAKTAFVDANSLSREASSQTSTTKQIPLYPSVKTIEDEGGWEAIDAPTVGEILNALSRALDMTEGQPRGHAARTAMIALELGRQLRLTDLQLEDLYYAALLKDSGCSANSRRIQRTFGGDEIQAKQAVKFVDWAKPTHAIGFAIQHAEPGGKPLQRIQRLLKMAGPPGKAMDEATSERCERGADIAKRLGFSDNVATAIRYLMNIGMEKEPQHISPGTAFPYCPEFSASRRP
jgi:hypothetical protein